MADEPVTIDDLPEATPENTDYLAFYDRSETGTEKTKKTPVSSLPGGVSRSDLETEIKNLNIPRDLGALENVADGATGTNADANYLRRAPGTLDWTLSIGLHADDLRGTINAARIPTLDIATKTSGSLPADRITGLPSGGTPTDFGNIAANVLPDGDNTRNLGSVARSWDEVHNRRTIKPVTNVPAAQQNTPTGIRDVHTIDFSGNDIQTITVGADPFWIRGNNYMAGREITVTIINNGGPDAELFDDSRGDVNANGWRWSLRGINRAQGSGYTIHNGDCIILKFICTGNTAASVCVGRLP